MTEKNERVFSAPGKALLAGGYLVLDPVYDSYVTALSSRMHALVRAEKSLETTTILIKSPQFLEGEWSYQYDPESESTDKFRIPEITAKFNPFTESTVSTVLAYVDPTDNYDISITIFSDPGYHSQLNTVQKTAIKGTRKFLYHSSPITEVAKTGLGSSAGLVSVVTTALLSVYQPELDPTSSKTKDILHNLSQISHCLAQKKIGSGFDVAAAIYGSIIYRRFKPELINELINDDITDSAEYCDQLKKLVHSDWQFVSETCSLPPRIRLLMGDVQGGSNTPKLVSKVFSWRKSDGERAENIYKDLNSGNLRLIAALNALNKLAQDNPDQYNKTIDYFSKRKIISIESFLQLQHDFKNEIASFLDLVEAIKSIRHNLRLITRYSGADIEPVEQTLLLNQMANLNGVLGGIVPGAGGYDAVCLLVIEDCIPEIIGQTTGEDELHQFSTVDRRFFSNVTWLDLHEEARGVLEEDLEDYEGLY